MMMRRRPSTTMKFAPSGTPPRRRSFWRTSTRPWARRGVPWLDVTMLGSSTIRFYCHSREESAEVWVLLQRNEQMQAWPSAVACFSAL